MKKLLLILILTSIFGCINKEKKGWTGKGYTLTQEQNKSCKEVCRHFYVDVKWYGKYCKCSR